MRIQTSTGIVVVLLLALQFFPSLCWAQHERAYVEAVGTRSSKGANADQKKLAANYTAAMADLVRKYPDDLDAATLYAESLMVPNRWRWFDAEGKAAQGTAEAIAALESVL